MRDPKRIEKYCDEMKEIWAMVPDWRFGQLICNFERFYLNDTFFVEDDAYFKALKKYIKEAIS